MAIDYEKKARELVALLQLGRQTGTPNTDSAVIEAMLRQLAAEVLRDAAEEFQTHKPEQAFTKAYTAKMARLAREIEVEIAVGHDLDGMEMIDQCDYASVAWRCIKKKKHTGGHSPS